MTEMAERNFFRDRELYVDPYPYYEALRAQGPVVVEPHYDVAMVNGYEEVIAVLNDSAVWSSCNTVTGPFFPFPAEIEGDDITELVEQHRDEIPFSDQMPSFDPPKHTAHRALTMRLITPKRLKENEDAMWDLADQQLDEFIGNGRCEFVSEYAAPYTLIVIADLLGVPPEDRGSFRDRLASPLDLAKKDTGIEHKPLEFLYEQFSNYVTDRRAHPRDDALTGLAQATFPDGSEPPVHDVSLIAANLFVAGQETTVRLLTAMLQRLGDHPDLQARLRRERALIPNFVEEMLRYESPIKGPFRLARKSTEVAGTPLKAGTCAMAMLGAANRDPCRFEDPDVFDVDRTNARGHIAFGHGAHTCAGAPLARSEARVSLERLFDRTSDIRISEAKHGPHTDRHYDYMPLYLIRGINDLHLEFDPVG